MQTPAGEGGNWGSGRVSDSLTSTEIPGAFCEGCQSPRGDGEASAGESFLGQGRG